MHPDKIYMKRCIELAKKASKNTYSNPMVGALLVYNNRIIGEGFHEYFGQAHAEINAINAVKSEDHIFISKSTLYVSLEPCSHTSKTPPCADRIVKEKIPKVVIGCSDPNPKVAGNGIKYLERHGVEVTCPVLEKEAKFLIGKFEANLQGLPYVILKWAQSEDLYISKRDTQTWLSNKYSSILTHQWRSEVDGIMIGKNTAEIDNPKLNVRWAEGPSPIRIVLDTNLSSSPHLNLFSDGLPSIVINQIKESGEDHVKYKLVKDIRNMIEVLKKIYQEGITSIIVEGGYELINSFIQSGLWHEARVIKTKVKLSEGIKAPLADGILLQRYNLLNDDIILIGNPNLRNHD